MSDDAIETVQSTGHEAEVAPTAESSTDAATVQEPEQQVEGGDGPKKPAKIPDSVQRRINELTRQRHEGQRTIDAQQQELETYRRLLAAQQDPSQTQQPYQPPQPAQDPQALAQQIVAEQQFNQACDAIYEQGKAEFADFDEAVSNLGVLGVQPDFIRAVASFDKPAALLHALASDLDAAERILAMPPVQQGRELERLAHKAAAPKAPPVSKAPAPIAPVDGTASVETDPNKMSMDEWVKWRESQVSKRKGR